MHLDWMNWFLILTATEGLRVILNALHDFCHNYDVCMSSVSFLAKSDLLYL